MMAIALTLALVVAGFAGLWLLTELRRRPVDAGVRSEATGEFVRLSRGRTHYRWIGPESGPVVVCVHGLTTPSALWEQLAGELAAQGYRVLVYDLYGRGFSDRPFGRQGTALFCGQLDEVLRDQGVETPVTLIGYSMGGAIVTAFAARWPERVARLVLLAPTGFGHDLGRFLDTCRRVPVIGDLVWALHGGEHLLETTTTPKRFPSLPHLIATEVSHRGYLRSVLSSSRHMLAQDQDDLHAGLAARGLPVLAIWGGCDDVIPATAPGRLARVNRGALQDVVEGAEHGLPYTHTDAVLRRILPYLEERKSA